ncbi:nuclear transport factor 2 family protein [Actinomadura vinacea]|uniref:Nuclear transport factor 2 family protein n=1 Tax=Actinomadura vinacea TaxID=115336 RepID=A0ABN3IPD7_9ACTN
MDDIEALKQLKARYCRTLDTKDWDGMRQIFTDDVVMDTTGSGGTLITGADTFMAFVRDNLADRVTVHHCHTPEIAITSPSTATGIWAMEDRVQWPSGRELIGFGHYHETYEKTDGTWRIRTSKLTRLRMDITEPVATYSS